MTLNELRYVVAVARERHFGRAADACFVSQPTLSVAVRKLEDELGVSLFERGPGEVTVTAVGQRIVEQAQRVLEEAEGVRRLARQGKNPLVGPLRLGAIYTVGPYLLPHLVPLVAERAPDMPLMIEENFTAVLAERLKRGDLDLIVISLPFEAPGIVTRPLYDERFVVLLPTSHPWQARPSIAIADLAGENVLSARLRPLLSGPGSQGLPRLSPNRYRERGPAAAIRGGIPRDDPLHGGERGRDHGAALHREQRGPLLRP